MDFVDHQTDLDILHHLTICYAEDGNFPWSTCAWLSEPRVDIGTRTWHTRRVRALMPGIQAYGYSRRQVKQIIAALQAALVALVERQGPALRGVAADIGFTDTDLRGDQ